MQKATLAILVGGPLDGHPAIYDGDEYVIQSQDDPTKRFVYRWFGLRDQAPGYGVYALGSVTDRQVADAFMRLTEAPKPAAIVGDREIPLDLAGAAAGDEQSKH